MATQRTAESLTATTGLLLKWLQSKKPREIVAENMGDPARCLGASFLRANGHPDALVAWSTGYYQSGKSPGSFRIGTRVAAVLLTLIRGKKDQVTAQRAIRAVEQINALTMAEAREIVF